MEAANEHHDAKDGGRACTRAEAPLVEIEDAAVVRAGKTILSVPSFRLGLGENVALLGPNGSGKSTFVKLITREIVPLHRDRPPVRFKGQPRVVVSEVKKSLGIVSSSMQDQISVHLPAIDVVEGGLFGSLGMPAHAHGTDETRAWALASLRQLGVEDLAERDIMTLSTGQARRILIARALVHDPETLVFDEPCTGLDPEGMYYVRKSMRVLARAGKGIVLVTHYPEDVIPEIGRIVLIKRGQLFADGAKRDMLTDEVMSRLFDVPLHVERRGPSCGRLDEASSSVARAAESSAPSAALAACEGREEEYFSLVSAY